MSTGKKIAIAAAVIVGLILLWKLTAPSPTAKTDTVPEPITESSAAQKFRFKPVRQAGEKLRALAPRLFLGVKVV